MRLRRNAEVGAAQDALDAAAARQAEVLAEIGGRQAQRDALAEDPAGFQQNEAAIRDLEAEHDRLGLVVGRREQELDEAKRQAAHDEWQRSNRELVKAYGARREATAAIGPAVAALAAAVASAELKRAEAQDLEERYRALTPNDVDEFAFPSANRDEVDWDPLDDDVVEFLRVGARQPEAAAAERHARRADEERRVKEERVPRMVAMIVRGGVTDSELEGSFADLLEREREEALRAAERQLVDVEADVRNRYSHPLSLEGPDSRAANHDVERIVGMIRGRINELRAV
jgi:hypothetical protein